jgi:F-type H+-transporting ATPase subunit b
MTLISMMSLAVAAADEASGEEAGAFPPFDPTYFASQIFWLVISFGALYFLMSRWILPRIGGVIEERRDRIADDLDVAQQVKSDAEETRAAYEKSLADARARAHALAAEAKAEVDREIAEETAEVDAEIAAKSEEAEKALAEARTKALAEVRNIAAGSAADAANRLAALSVSEADAAKAIAAMDKD